MEEHGGRGLNSNFISFTNVVGRVGVAESWFNRTDAVTG